MVQNVRSMYLKQIFKKTLKNSFFILIRCLVQKQYTAFCLKKKKRRKRKRNIQLFLFPVGLDTVGMTGSAKPEAVTSFVKIIL